MGRLPCCDKGEVKKGAWTPEEDRLLLDYITKNGHGTWRSFPKLAGLRRCGKSCRLRWTNYLRPDIKRGTFTFEEEQTIFQLHSFLGNKWAAIASRLPGRTDNEIKNYWNSHLRKRVPTKNPNLQANSASRSADTKPNLLSTSHMAEWESARVEAEARLAIDPIVTGVTNGDYFMKAWNSEGGNAFQRGKESVVKVESESVVKVESESVITMQADEATNSSSYSPNSYKTEKSSDITLDLLLDFPNEGEYLQYLNDNSA